MIVSPSRRFVFVHIPKTGGTSLSLALEGRARRDDILIGDTPKARRRKGRLASLGARGRLWKHARLADLDGYLDPEDLRSYFVFTIVRNPWDRMVSYHHWLKAQDFAHPAVSLARRTTLEEFLLDGDTQTALRNDAARRYVTDASGVERCDLFLRFEALDDGAVEVARRIGCRLDLPHANRSGRDADYRRAYGPASAERVAQIFAEDIARFGYRF